MVLFFDCGWDLVLIYKGGRRGVEVKNIENIYKRREYCFGRGVVGRGFFVGVGLVVLS